MSTHSKDGRPWAKLSELEPRDKIIADGGFDCIAENAVLEVKVNTSGELYVDCKSHGGHALDGQLSEDNNDSLVGFWRA